MPTPYYEHAGITIYHGDCREILPTVTADVVVTDPPYGLAAANTQKNEYVSFADDPEEVVRLVLPVVERFMSSRLVMTPGQSLMFRYPPPDAIGAFYYPAGPGSCAWGFVGWQPIFYYGKDPRLARGMGRASNSMSTTERADDFGHPCVKPIRAWRWLVNRASMDGETILDPFMGSGTTLRAAKDLGRRAIGIEIEEKYCEIAVKRMSQEVLFPAVPIQP